eukprot:MONOS_2491.1-p1 / transcript=MONOS_2491.1 / gene=MONOS_2491 / organism=Monocercomonoides_exilis_PA203 / gene_product=phosphatidylinositol-3-phosphate / transcript_product=phosphatidylinositol-3-phosphate / location=Mono_scaffold00052:3796-12164(-) / protein_length=2569 / sequence_SO=supercontig / SO=protein_coding / is_pseudo=false
MLPLTLVRFFDKQWKLCERESFVIKGLIVRGRLLTNATKSSGISPRILLVSFPLDSSLALQVKDLQFSSLITQSEDSKNSLNTFKLKVQSFFSPFTKKEKSYHPKSDLMDLEETIHLEEQGKDFVLKQILKLKINVIATNSSICMSLCEILENKGISIVKIDNKKEMERLSYCLNIPIASTFSDLEEGHVAWCDSWSILRQDDETTKKEVETKNGIENDTSEFVHGISAADIRATEEKEGLSNNELCDEYFYDYRFRCINNIADNKTSTKHILQNEKNHSEEANLYNESKFTLSISDFTNSFSSNSRSQFFPPQHFHQPSCLSSTLHSEIYLSLLSRLVPFSGANLTRSINRISQSIAVGNFSSSATSQLHCISSAKSAPSFLASFSHAEQTPDDSSFPLKNRTKEDSRSLQGTSPHSSSCFPSDYFPVKSYPQSFVFFSTKSFPRISTIVLQDPSTTQSSDPSSSPSSSASDSAFSSTLTSHESSHNELLIAARITSFALSFCQTLDYLELCSQTLSLDPSSFVAIDEMNEKTQASFNTSNANKASNHEKDDIKWRFLQLMTRSSHRVIDLYLIYQLSLHLNTFRSLLSPLLNSLSDMWFFLKIGEQTTSDCEEAKVMLPESVRLTPETASSVGDNFASNLVNSTDLKSQVHSLLFPLLPNQTICVSSEHLIPSNSLKRQLGYENIFLRSFPIPVNLSRLRIDQAKCTQQNQSKFGIVESSELLTVPSTTAELANSSKSTTEKYPLKQSNNSFSSLFPFGIDPYTPLLYTYSFSSRVISQGTFCTLPVTQSFSLLSSSSSTTLGNYLLTRLSKHILCQSCNALMQDHLDSFETEGFRVDVAVEKLSSAQIHWKNHSKRERKSEMKKDKEVEDTKKDESDKKFCHNEKDNKKHSDTEDIEVNANSISANDTPPSSKSPNITNTHFSSSSSTSSTNVGSTQIDFEDDSYITIFNRCRVCRKQITPQKRVPGKLLQMPLSLFIFMLAQNGEKRNKVSPYEFKYGHNIKRLIRKEKELEREREKEKEQETPPQKDIEIDNATSNLDISKEREEIKNKEAKDDFAGVSTYKENEVELQKHSESFSSTQKLSQSFLKYSPSVLHSMQHAEFDQDFCFSSFIPSSSSVALPLPTTFFFGEGENDSENKEWEWIPLPVCLCDTQMESVLPSSFSHQSSCPISTSRNANFHCYPYIPKSPNDNVREDNEESFKQHENHLKDESLKQLEELQSHPRMAIGCPLWRNASLTENSKKSQTYSSLNFDGYSSGAFSSSSFSEIIECDHSSFLNTTICFSYRDSVIAFEISPFFPSSLISPLPTLPLPQGHLKHFFESQQKTVWGVGMNVFRQCRMVLLNVVPIPGSVGEVASGLLAKLNEEEREVMSDVEMLEWNEENHETHINRVSENCTVGDDKYAQAKHKGHMHSISSIQMHSSNNSILMLKLLVLKAKVLHLYARWAHRLHSLKSILQKYISHTEKSTPHRTPSPTVPSSLTSSPSASSLTSQSSNEITKSSSVKGFRTSRSFSSDLFAVPSTSSSLSLKSQKQISKEKGKKDKTKRGKERREKKGSSLEKNRRKSSLDLSKKVDQSSSVAATSHHSTTSRVVSFLIGSKGSDERKESKSFQNQVIHSKSNDMNENDSVNTLNHNKDKAHISNSTSISVKNSLTDNSNIDQILSADLADMPFLNPDTTKIPVINEEALILTRKANTPRKEASELQIENEELLSDAENCDERSVFDKDDAADDEYDTTDKRNTEKAGLTFRNECTMKENPQAQSIGMVRETFMQNEKVQLKPGIVLSTLVDHLTTTPVPSPVPVPIASPAQSFTSILLPLESTASSSSVLSYNMQLPHSIDSKGLQLQSSFSHIVERAVKSLQQPLDDSLIDFESFEKNLEKESGNTKFEKMHLQPSFVEGSTPITIAQNANLGPIEQDIKQTNNISEDKSVSNVLSSKLSHPLCDKKVSFQLEAQPEAIPDTQSFYTTEEQKCIPIVQDSPHISVDPTASSLLHQSMIPSTPFLLPSSPSSSSSFSHLGDPKRLALSPDILAPSYEEFVKCLSSSCQHLFPFSAATSSNSLDYFLPSNSLFPMELCINERQLSTMIAYSLLTSEYEQKMNELLDAAETQQQIFCEKQFTEEKELNAVDFQKGSFGSQILVDDSFIVASNQTNPTEKIKISSAINSKLMPGKRVTFSERIKSASVQKAALLSPKHNVISVNISNKAMNVTCTFYSPLQFHALRESSITHSAFVSSLAAGSFSVKMLGGKSKAKFWKTKDDRFILKKISKIEMSEVVNSAGAYFEHFYDTVFEKQPSLMLPIYAIVGIDFKPSSSSSSFLTSASRTAAAASLSEESTFQFSSDVSTSATALHDSINFSEDYSKHSISSPPSISHQQTSSLQSSSSPFQSNVEKLKGYFIVLENLFCGSQMKRMFDLKGSRRSRYVRFNRSQDEVLLDSNYVVMMVMMKEKLAVREKDWQMMMKGAERDAQFLSRLNVVDYSLIVGVDENNHTIRCGIIDYLRQYTWDKQFESRIKKSYLLNQGDVLPTIIHPSEYKLRFIDSLKEYITSIPEQFSSCVITSQMLKYLNE